jgi:polyisoprenoid-binding protein YceI
MNRALIAAVSLAAPAAFGLSQVMDRGIALPEPIYAEAPAADLAPGEWTIDSVHSMVGFEVGHMGASRVGGRFNEYSGKVVVDPASITGGSVNITIKAASVDTANGARDNHLRSDDFFGVESHPNITFTSSSVESKGEGRYVAKGSLTMLGQSKAVEIPFIASAPVADARAGRRMGFNCEPIVIKRSDFGMSYGVANGAISNEVTIRLSAAVTAPAN